MGRRYSVCLNCSIFYKTFSFRTIRYLPHHSKIATCRRLSGCEQIKLRPKSTYYTLSFPLAQHTMPVIGGKSYIDKPQWKYNRLKGIGEVERNDIVVFNFPVGDTVALNQQGVDFYTLAKHHPSGSLGVRSDVRSYGKIVYRPVDRRENYVKRCIGLPGKTLELRNDSVYIDGSYLPNPRLSQHNYMIHTDGTQIAAEIFSNMGINKADYITQNNYGQMVPRSQDLTGVDSLSLSIFNLRSRNGNNGRVYFSIPMTAMVDEMNAKPFVWDIIKERDFLAQAITSARLYA